MWIDEIRMKKRDEEKNVDKVEEENNICALHDLRSRF